MQEKILERLKEKFPHHAPALISSFIYVLVSMPIYGKDKIAFAFLFLVFITSLFYHSHPENKFFRIGDWLASITFIFYIINLSIHSKSGTIFLIIFGIFSVLFWLISEISFYSKFNKIYNVSHTFWHILSAITIFLIIASL